MKVDPFEMVEDGRVVDVFDRGTDDGTKEGWAKRPRFIPKGPSIIVVGPDGVGKTTVVANMSRLTEIPSFKCPSEKRIFKDGGRNSLTFDYTLTHFLEQTGYRFISDRGYPCEWVYSKVFARNTDTALLEMIDGMRAALDTRILYLYSSIQPFQDDDIVPPEKYFDVKKMYDAFCEWTSCKVTAIDTKEMLLSYRDGIDTSEAMTGKCMGLIGEIF